METILITGGAGFIGSHVVEKLLGQDKKVVCLDNFDPFYDPSIKRANLAHAVKNKNFHLVEDDILNRAVLDKLFREHRIETVFHCAARAGVRPSIQDPFSYQKVNVEGTLNLLEAARTYRIRNFVFASSSSVYGAGSRLPFTEEDPADRPLSPYAATKRAGELLCHTYHHLYGLPVTSLRFFTVYGPRQRPEMAIHQFTRLIDLGKPLTLYGDGTSSRDYTHIDDIVEGVLAALSAPIGSEVINLGGSRVTELRQLVILIEKALGKKATVEFRPEQAGDVPITFADVGKARRLLGYEPRTPIEEGIQKFVEWYKRGSGSASPSAGHGGM